MSLTGSVKCSVAQLFKMPITLVAILEGGKRQAYFPDILKDPTIDGLPLQGPAEPSGHAVDLRLGAEGNASEFDLIIGSWKKRKAQRWAHYK